MTPSLINFLKEHKKIKRVAILGPTGSGKTTFIDGFFGDIDRTGDVIRRIAVEKKVDNSFVQTAATEESSTTTVSMNQLAVTLILTKSNFFKYVDRSKKEEIDEEDIDSKVEVQFIDNPGQERFIFFSEITVKGADAVIIVLDGTSSVSIAALPKFLDIVKQEEERREKHIPKLVFINKLDLSEQNLFLGMGAAMQMLGDMIKEYKIVLFETTNKEFVTFEVPLRTLMHLI